MKRLLPIAFLIALLVTFSWASPRLQGLLPGFSPLPPLFFCVAACMATRWVWLPALAWALSYFLINFSRGYDWSPEFFFVVAGLAATFAVGIAMRERSFPFLIGGSLGAALGFYLVTNTGSWFLSDYYAKTWPGWLQSQTKGIPGYPPAWMFLKGQMAATALFTALFLLGQRQTSRTDGKTPTRATVPEGY